MTRDKLTFAALALLLAFGFASCKDDAIDSADEADTVRFLAIGDFGWHGNAHQQSVADAMEILARSTHIDFVLALGDNFYPEGVTSVDDPQWKTSFENVYNGDSLKQLPWYVTLGNHDYISDPSAQIAYSKISNRWTMPDYYYTITFPLDEEIIRLVVMDTNPFEKPHYDDPNLYTKFTGDTTTQKVWLDSVFSLKDAAWTIVSGHHPFYTGGLRANNPNSVRTSLLPLFTKHDLPIYFSGHEHDLQHLKPDGNRLNQFVNGAGSEIRPTGSIESTKFSASDRGVMSVEVTKNAVRVFVINANLDTLYQTTVIR